MKQTKEGRLVYADLLRAAALIAVIALHVCGNNWQGLEVKSADWQVLNVADSLTRWCVPVFVMLSGMFFLDPDKPVTYRSIFKKSLPRLATAFLFWSFLYALFTALLNWRSGTPDDPWQFFLNFIYGHYHLWFVYMMMGLYLVTPVLRKFIAGAGRRDIEYLLLIYFIFTLIVPLFGNAPRLQVISGVAHRLDLKLLGGYMGYFVAGYYLKAFDFQAKTKKIIYGLGIFGLAVTIGMTWLDSLAWDAPNEKWYLYLTPNVALMAFAVFLFFKERCDGRRIGPKGVELCSRIAQRSFGIYLVHAFFNNRLVSLGLDAVTFTPLISVPLATALVFAASYAAVWLIEKIPPLRKHIL